jgi:hypothetical protein
MPKKLVFDDDALRRIVASSVSFWMVAKILRPHRPGAIYKTAQRRIRELGIDTSHFTFDSRRERRWTDDDLRTAVRSSRNVSQVIRRLGLIPAGGNYDQVQRRIALLEINTSHFNRSGVGWAKGMVLGHRPLDAVLVAGIRTSSHSLKLRLFRAGLKTPRCETCGWAECDSNGRIPVELDHINGDRFDNRLENLRILCPNCHSLQPTHRGLNKQSMKAKRNMASEGRTLRWAHRNPVGSECRPPGFLIQCVARGSNPQALLKAGIFKTPEYTEFLQPRGRITRYHGRRRALHGASPRQRASARSAAVSRAPFR